MQHRRGIRRSWRLSKVATEATLSVLDASRLQGCPIASTSVLSDYWELTKPEINFLIVITTAAGFWMGAAAPLAAVPWMPLLQSLLGTALVASGAATLNQLI